MIRQVLPVCPTEHSRVSRLSVFWQIVEKKDEDAEIFRFDPSCRFLDHLNNPVGYIIRNSQFCPCFDDKTDVASNSSVDHISTEIHVFPKGYPNAPFHNTCYMCTDSPSAYAGRPNSGTSRPLRSTSSETRRGWIAFTILKTT